MLDVKKCVKNCVEKYGLSEKEALRIASTDNILLSIEDLRYKYDDMRIGTDYPEWITPEEHMKMCYATVWRKYNTNYFWFNSCEDVAMDLFIYSSIHLHSYNDKYKLNGLLLCRLKNLIRDNIQELKCYAEQYDWEGEKCEEITDDNRTRYDKANTYNAVTKDIHNTTELILNINSIRNEKVRGILLLCCYFLADIPEVLDSLVNFYANSSDKVKEKIYDLGRDDNTFCNAIHKSINEVGKTNVTLGRILKVFGKRDKTFVQTDIIPYLKDIGLMI